MVPFNAGGNWRCKRGKILRTSLMTVSGLADGVGVMPRKIAFWPLKVTELL